jgi:hypothetical protein
MNFRVPEDEAWRLSIPNPRAAATEGVDPEKYDAESRLLINVELAREAIDSVGIDVALCLQAKSLRCRHTAVP